MKQKELNKIVKLHSKWLHGEEGGVRANLSEADLSEANLSEANLDFACWSLSCKSTSIKSDAKIVGQLLWHAFEHAKFNGIDIDDIEKLKELANNSSPVVIHGREKV